jgi:hypothetical protein
MSLVCRVSVFESFNLLHFAISHTAIPVVAADHEVQFNRVGKIKNAQSSKSGFSFDLLWADNYCTGELTHGYGRDRTANASSSRHAPWTNQKIDHPTGTATAL